MSPAPGREVRASARCATRGVALIMRTAIIMASLMSAALLVHRTFPVDAAEITCSQ